VILASGLDARAYRLAWPSGTTVYEIDQPEVIEFKTRTLAELGAEPTAKRRTVAMDLRYDWPSALIEEGFDPNQPTAWSAEGLLGYLPPAAQDRLLDTITELSAPCSRIALESVPNVNPADHEKAIERMRDASERWRDHGFDLDFAELVYLGDRNEAAAYLGDHGWELTRNSVKELFAANGLPPMDEKAEEVGNFGELQYVSGVLKGGRR
jgi:methyltransferase (TIGR00027 family)